MTDNPQQPDRPPFDEPSVLDYIKSLFRSGDEKIQLPKFVEEEQPSAVSHQPLAVSNHPEESQLPITDGQSTPFPWRSLLALGMALPAQRFLEPPPNTVPLGIGLYIAALSALGWAIYRGEWNLIPHAPSSEGNDPLTYRGISLAIGSVLAVIAFPMFSGNMFTFANVIVWLAAVIFFVAAFWVYDPNNNSLFGGLRGVFKNGLTIKLSAWTLLLIAATALVFFFRFYRTEGVPPEPFSDHAEKILDVYDVSQGQTHIFFPRNTGREAIQMYWTLLISKIFNTGLSFLSLKLGTAILGFLTLPFMYLLGKEIGGPRVGLFTFILTGIGYWPNVISRIGLRFPLYPLFAAPTLLFLIRGLRTRNRNDFILSGIFLGLGLHGYSPMRIVPIVVGAAFVIYWLHAQSKGAHRDLPVWFAILALTSLMVFLPLLRYWTEHPAEFGFRAMTRLTGEENPITQPILNIFSSNVWKALKMFNFDDGEIWVNSLPHRPAFDVVTGALFILGVALILIRYVRKRHWLDLYLLVSIPLLQLPSTLSLAFPGENPALNRAGGAYIPAFIISALALDGLLTSFGRGKPALSRVEAIRSVFVWGISILLIVFSVRQNFNILFNQFYNSFRQGAWNTSDMGREIRKFEQAYGETDTVWVVPFPYWVDTRLPAVWAGIPNRDMAMWRDNLSTTVSVPGPKMFIVKANLQDPNTNDQETLDVLEKLYPDGQLRLFSSDVAGHDFWIFFVPGT